jgi:hypothetical protein
MYLNLLLFYIPPLWRTQPSPGVQSHYWLGLAVLSIQNCEKMNFCSLLKITALKYSVIAGQNRLGDV